MLRVILFLPPLSFAGVGGGGSGVIAFPPPTQHFKPPTGQYGYKIRTEKAIYQVNTVASFFSPPPPSLKVIHSYGVSNGKAE